MDGQIDNENHTESGVDRGVDRENIGAGAGVDNDSGNGAFNGAGGQTRPERLPFTFGSILTDGFSCFKDNIRSLLLLILAVTLPMALIQVFMIDRNFDYSGTVNTFMELYTADAASGAESEISGIAWKIMLYLGISALISSVSLITEAGAIILVGRKHGWIRMTGESVTEPLSDREQPGFSALFELAFRSFPKLWLTMFFVRFSVFMGFMLCFIPGVLLYYVFQFSAFSVVFCGLWGRKAGFVSSLATRVYPKPSLICALTFFAVSEVLLGLAISVLASLPVQLGLGAVAAGVISVVLRCAQQLLSLMFTMMAATLFAQMLPKLSPIIESSGVRGGRK